MSAYYDELRSIITTNMGIFGACCLTKMLSLTGLIPSDFSGWLILDCFVFGAFLLSVTTTYKQMLEIGLQKFYRNTLVQVSGLGYFVSRVPLTIVFPFYYLFEDKTPTISDFFGFFMPVAFMSAAVSLSSAPFWIWVVNTFGAVQGILWSATHTTLTCLLAIALQRTSFSYLKAWVLIMVYSAVSVGQVGMSMAAKKLISNINTTFTLEACDAVDEVNTILAFLSILMFSQLPSVGLLTIFSALLTFMCIFFILTRPRYN